MREQEFELKFLVNSKKLFASEEFKNASKVWWIMQGYLSSDEKKAIRVRCEQLLRNFKSLGVKAFKWDNVNTPLPMEIAGGSKLYIKTSSNTEFSYDVPYPEFKEMYETLCEGKTLEKYRYYVEYKGKTFHVDVFKGKLEPLVIAELELDNLNVEFHKPDWLDIEVTKENIFKNSQLVSVDYEYICRLYAKEINFIDLCQ